MSMDATSVRWPFWIGIVTDHLERQRAFYRTCSVSRSHSSVPTTSSSSWTAISSELLRRTDDPEYDRPRIQIGFEVTDIRAARSRLIDQGAEPVTEILGGPESSNSRAYFRDADGNVF